MSPRNLILLAALTIFWGVNWPIMKIGLQDIPIWTFRGIASLSGGLGLLAIAWFRGGSLRIHRRERFGLVLAAMFNIAIWNIAMLYGLSMMESGRASIIAFTMPVWSTLLSIFILKETVKPMQIIGLLLGMSGLFLLLAVDFATLERSPLGALLILGAALAWAIGTVMVRYFRFSASPTVLAGWQQVIGAAPVVVIMLFYDIHHIDHVGFWPGFSLLYNMIVTGILCYWIWFSIITTVPVVIATVSTLLIPVIGLFSGQLILGEQPGWSEYLALVLILAAIAAVMQPQMKRS